MKDTQILRCRPEARGKASPPGERRTRPPDRASATGFPSADRRRGGRRGGTLSRPTRPVGLGGAEHASRWARRVEDPWCWDVPRETHKEDFGVMECLPRPVMRGNFQATGLSAWIVNTCPVSARGRTLTLQIHVVLVPLRKPRTYHHACRTDSDCPRSDAWLESRPTSCVN